MGVNPETLLFLHYAFDTRMVREFPGVWFERYADDAVLHCMEMARSLPQLKGVLSVMRRHAHAAARVMRTDFRCSGLRITPSCVDVDLAS